VRNVDDAGGGGSGFAGVVQVRAGERVDDTGDATEAGVVTVTYDEVARRVDGDTEFVAEKGAATGVPEGV